MGDATIVVKIILLETVSFKDWIKILSGKMDYINNKALLIIGIGGDFYILNLKIKWTINFYILNLKIKWNIDFYLKLNCISLYKVLDT